MSLNGYVPDGHGNFIKDVEFPFGRKNKNSVNDYHDRLVRNCNGKLIKVISHKKLNKDARSI